MMGIQLILPALPAMQDEFSLSDGEVALVTSVYLLPSVAFAFISGLLADRFGRRLIYAVALGVFGLAGLAQLIVPSFAVFLLLRLVQGAAFAAIHPLSITMIGDMLTGMEQVSAQGHRVVAMSLGDTLLPVVGGAMVALGWHAPFALQALALPLAVAAWFGLPAGKVAEHSAVVHVKELVRVLHNATTLSLQVAGFLRMFFKFAFMTYLPIVLVGGRGMTPTFVGVALGGAALCGTVVAALSGPLVRWVPPSRLMAFSLVLISGAFVGIALGGASPVLTLAASLAFGAADGGYGVLQNAAVTQAISDDMRATFVAATGSVRNFGKFLAPSLLGLSTLVLPLEVAFLLLAFLALLALWTIAPLSRLDAHLVGDQVGLAH
jgi:MFS family permease